MSEKDNLENEQLNDIVKKISESSRDLAKKLPVFGNVLWLYMQSDSHKHYFVQDLESRALPPIMKDQCKLYLQTKAGGLPMAYVSWAYLSEDAEKVYCATQKIAPKDWKSGDNLWLIDVLTPFGGNERIFAELYHKVFKQQDIYVLYPDDTGNLSKKSLKELAGQLAVPEDEEQDDSPEIKH